jgi:hypothetical protein
MPAKAFNLAAWVRASTQAQSVPERLNDRDTVLAVVRHIILAKQSSPLSGQTPIPDRPPSANGDRPANLA